MQQNGLNNKKRFFIIGQFNEYYQTESVESMTSKDFFNLSESTIQDIYDRYDELMNQDQSVDRNLLGYGTGTDGLESKSLPIYEYVIRAPETSQKTHGDAGVTDLFSAPTKIGRAHV